MRGMSQTMDRLDQQGTAEPAKANASETDAGGLPRALLQKKIQRRALQRKEAQAAGPTAAEAEAAPHAAAETVGPAASAPTGVDLAALQTFIAGHEGSVHHVYLDSRGFKTAGIGHLLTGGTWTVGQPVSAEQVTAWFNADVATAMAGARQVMGASFDKLDEARKMVIIDMVFNLGVGGFAAFHRTIAAIEAGQYAQAATDMLQSAWAGQVGRRATEDAAIMRGGALPGGGGTGGAQTGGGAQTHNGGQTHGTGQAPAGGHSGGSANKAAPSLDEVRSGHATLQEGESGSAVAEVQRLLHVSADGTFGPHTKAAVESFQRAHHLTVDGVVGSKTLAALQG